jgi:hypothetical protein
MNEPSKFGKAAHNLGMSAWFGGTLFGQVALNPTVSSIWRFGPSRAHRTVC